MGIYLAALEMGGPYKREGCATLKNINQYNLILNNIYFGAIGK